MELKESETVEFKESLEEDAIIETAIAFANMHGGTIYVGVNDEGKTVGVSLGKGKIESLVNKINREVKPSLHPHIEERKIDGKTVIIITVEESETKPHFYKGVTYKRMAKSTMKIIEPLELEKMFKTKAYHFDSEINKDATIDDIDSKAVEKFYETALSSGRIKESFISVKDTLAKLGLIKGSHFNNAALLLFGKNPSSFFPQCSFKCAYFLGTEIVKIESIDENIFNQIENVISFFLKYVEKKVAFEGLVRREIPMIPHNAIREAIINAVIHRDYSIHASSYLTITKDHIEIKNPGILPFGITKEDLFKQHPSLPRNALMAQTIYRFGLIEQWGTGTGNMIESVRKNGLEDPIFEERQGFFHVRFLMRERHLNQRQETALEILKTKKQIKAKELADRFKVSIKTAKLDLDELVRYQLVKKEGRARASMYILPKLTF